MSAEKQMSAEKLLSVKKQDILKNWFQITVETYPPDTARFLKNQKDPFTNPVGETTYRSLETLVVGLIDGGMGRDVMAAALDPVMRIRAVQAFSPSMATGFIFSLKQIIRRYLSEGRQFRDEALTELDQRIDEMALTAFDIYMACREQIYELKAMESRNQFFGSLKRAGLIAESEIVETEADGPGL